MLIKHQTRLRTALESQYSKTVGQLQPGYPHEISLMQFHQLVEATLSLPPGLVYSGEAEAVLFYPLESALNTAFQNTRSQGSIVQAAYQLAAAYSIIADITKVAQTKDIMREITNSAITANPVYVTITKHQEAAGQLTNSQGQHETELRAVWRVIDQFLNENMSAEPDASKVTPLSIVYQAQSVDSTTLPTATSEIWRNLIAHLRTGKGLPLSPDNADKHVARLMRVWRLIDELCTKAIDEAQSGADTAYFADAWTALAWFYDYMRAVADYDSIFPQSSIMVQSSAWVLAIRNQALKLKSFFSRKAIAAQSFDIQKTIAMWDEEMDFLAPSLPTTTSAVQDLQSLWARVRELASSTLDPFSAACATSTIKEFKSYLGVDTLLPAYQFKQISGKTEDGNAWSFTIPDPDPTKTGSDYLHAADTLGARDIFTGERTMLLAHLTASAANVEVALHYLTRALDVLSCLNPNEVLGLINPPQWEPLVSLHSKIGGYDYADFTPAHPIAERMAKYTGAIDDAYPITRDDLIVPKYVIPLMQKRTLSLPNEAKVFWPVDVSQIGLDPITKAYVRQPVPACYTWHRSSAHVDITIEGYKNVMQGLMGLSDTKDSVWHTLASIIHTYPSLYGLSLIDALAATMYVYRESGAEDENVNSESPADLTNATSGWKRFVPRVPLIYGVSDTAMATANAWNGRESDVVKIISIPASKGKSVKYAFVLHTAFPKAGDYFKMLFPISKGYYVQLPILRSFYESNEDTINKALGVDKDGSGKRLGTPADLPEIYTKIKTLKGGKDDFIKCSFYYPGAINLPHLTMSYADTAMLLSDEEYRAAEMLHVRLKYDQLTRIISVLVTVDNPISMVTAEDYEALLSSPDPSPISNVDIVDNKLSAGAHKESVTAEAQAPMPASQLAPEPANPNSGEGGSNKAAQAMAGAVSAAPLLDPSERDIDSNTATLTAPGKLGDSTPLERKPSSPLSGDASSDAAPSSGGATSQPGKVRFWKLVKDDKVVDVVEGDSAPAGYVPATEEEFMNFKSEGKHE